MTRSATVTALADMEYGGRAYVRGDAIVMSSTDALVLARRKKVSLTRGLQIPRKDLTPEPDPAPVTRTRRQYRRRDMRAEGTE